MNQPVRGETDADATGTNHLHVTIDILWKTFELSSKRRYYAPLIDRKAGEIRGFPPYPQSSRMPAWPHCAGRFFERGVTADFVMQGLPEGCARNERPVRGDNRTGQAIWALGVDGRSRRIQPRWGGITAPTYIGRSRVGSTFKRPRDFFDFFAGSFSDGNLLRGGRDWLRRRPIYRTPWRPPAGSGPVSGEPVAVRDSFTTSSGGLAGTAATGTAGAATMAETAANASAAPAPN